MATLPKKYIKKYGISKKAWNAFKNKTLSGGKRKKTTKKKVTTMARKKKRKTTAKKTRRRVVTQSVRMGAPRRRRRASIMTNRYMNALINSGVVGVGAVGSTILVNKTPWIKDLKPWQKALVQAGIGVMGIPLVKQPMLKKAVGGSTVGAVISLIIPMLPEGFSFYSGGEAIAAPPTASGRAFTAAELEEMRTMGIPIDTPEMGAILNLESMGRGSRKYASSY